MNRCQHTDEQMNDNEEAVNDNMSDKTAKQREIESVWEKEWKKKGKGFLFCLLHYSLKYTQAA